MPRWKNCVNCGDEYSTVGDLCKDCLPAPKAAVKPGSSPLPHGTAACPYCKAAVDWSNVGRMRREFEDNTVEVIYFCSSCRAWLEAAAWMEEEK